jgi:predicted O-methyltransferase YrrM
MAGEKSFRRLRMGLSTILGLRPQGFFIPYRHADSATPFGGYKEIEKKFNKSNSYFAEFISKFDKFSAEFEAIGPDTPPEPRWHQDWFPPLDAAATYTMVRDQKPARIVEVGSGHSTRFMARAVRDGGLDTKITAIDPAPRATITGLPIEIINATAQTVDMVVFEALQAGDILFIDSSHILMPGTDVDFLFNRVLPALPAGVLVHIHDIFLPDDYPESWTWRGYNEQQAAAPLIHTGGYELLFSSQYARTRLTDAIARSPVATLPMSKDAIDTSLWLKKKR